QALEAQRATPEQLAHERELRLTGHVGPNMRIPVRANAREAERLVAAAGADVVGGHAEQHALEPQVIEIVVQERAQGFGAVATTKVARVEVDAQDGRALLVPNVPKKD